MNKFSASVSKATHCLESITSKKAEKHALSILKYMFICRNTHQQYLISYVFLI